MADNCVTGQSGYNMHAGQAIFQGPFTGSENSHDGVNFSPSLWKIIHRNPCLQKDLSYPHCPCFLHTHHHFLKLRPSPIPVSLLLCLFIFVELLSLIGMMVNPSSIYTQAEVKDRLLSQRLRQTLYDSAACDVVRASFFLKASLKRHHTITRVSVSSSSQSKHMCPSRRLFSFILKLFIFLIKTTFSSAPG